MSKFSDQVHVTIGSFTQNVVYYDLKLSQKMADHHHFSFVWQYTGKAIIKPADQAKALRRYLGDEVIFTFKGLTGIRLMSKGIITELSSIDLHGSPVGLHVTGISHTIVLDDMKKSRNYLELTMDDIVLRILAEGPGEFYQRDSIRSTYDKEFKYMPQYNETSFDFLKRLAMRYGQWFYFDGMRMQFGQTKASKIKLINGASLHSFKIQTNMASHKIYLTGYDYNNSNDIRSAAARTASGSKDSFSSIVWYNQGTVAQSHLNIGVYTTNAQNKEEIEEMVKLQTAGSDANSVYYSGVSYLPLGIGQVFTIINQTIEHELIVIEVTHHSEVHGNYSCEFKAIPADVGAPHYTDVHVFAKAESQPAQIKDNNDPIGLGRVKVEFYGASGTAVSPWIRMIQPHSGSGKGFYFIPEIGEEVLVGFEGANAQYPYVIGTQYNGKESSGHATPKNDIKVIQTRSGCKIVINDATGSILTQDKAGSTIFQDGQGNVITDAIKDFIVNAQNIDLNASKSITTTAAMNISESAGVDKSTTVGMMLNTTVGRDNIINTAGSFIENIQGDLKSHTQKERQEVATKGIDTSAEGAITKHSKKEMQNNSTEKSKSN
ncbi:phage baseplate assembly protein V [Flavobacterium branchiarum]|uniref:Type VI secretion system Vgr family protein n=1 Tax=Flavobacterium branchiarum TaxID=1114870 RepID=A0ABV5FIX5_9FLAO|nr:phage baseplate assembly protein V [Flavobacterium branchiarum]MDN3675165.1 phage baseplate assembly protein V [Flavobacterium branchiarum]